MIRVAIVIPDVTAVTSGMADGHRPAGLTEGISSSTPVQPLGLRPEDFEVCRPYQILKKMLKVEKMTCSLGSMRC